MKESYSTLGKWFEYLNKDCDYEQWSQYLISTLQSLGNFHRGLDIGCGNGTFTRAFCKAGYQVSGMDISAEMLTTAGALAQKEGVRIEFLLGDITKLKVNGKVDFITAINDCINYVPPQKIKGCFQKVYKALNAGGVFLFDISSYNKLKNTLGNNLYGEDGDEITYLWFNHFEDDKVEMDLTFFVQEKDGKYQRFDEHHEQYAHQEEDLLNALQEVGFTAQAVGHLGKEKTQRIQFICKK